MGGGAETLPNNYKHTGVLAGNVRQPLYDSLGNVLPLQTKAIEDK
jgi:hypothetical protein